MTDSSTMLRLQGVSRRFGGIVAVDQVSFSVNTGSIVGLVGPNGAGKTTLLNVVSGFDRATTGKVEFRGLDSSRMSSHRLARVGLVRTFQHAHVFPTMTVQEALVASRHIAEGGHKFASIRSLLPNGKARAESREAAEEVMASLRLTDWSNAPCSALPYGIKKRLAIGFALACRPLLLLLDEPAAGLNSRETAELIEDMQKMKADGLTLLVVEHNMPLIMSVSEKVVVLDHGAMMAQGTPDEVSRDEKVVGAYLGRR